MRLALLVVALALAGCAAEPTSPAADAAPRTSTVILVDEDVLLRPGESAAFAFELPLGASSGVIHVDVIGTATRVMLEAPEGCEGEVAAPGPTGSAGSTISCDPIAAGTGELVLRADGGTLQGRLLFAASVAR